VPGNYLNFLRLKKKSNSLPSTNSFLVFFFCKGHGGSGRLGGSRFEASLGKKQLVRPPFQPIKLSVVVHTCHPC
jgi:hypothetical protein